MNDKDIAEQAYKNGYEQALKDIVPDGYRATWKSKFFAKEKENAELQKQVDKLKTFIDFRTANVMCDKCKQQTVKDTAKEITSKVVDLNIICGDDFRLFLDNFELWVKERYGVEVE